MKHSYCWKNVKMLRDSSTVRGELRLFQIEVYCHKSKRCAWLQCSFSSHWPFERILLLDRRSVYCSGHHSLPSPFFPRYSFINHPARKDEQSVVEVAPKPIPVINWLLTHPPICIKYTSTRQTTSAAIRIKSYVLIAGYANHRTAEAQEKWIKQIPLKEHKIQ